MFCQDQTLPMIYDEFIPCIINILLDCFYLFKLRYIKITFKKKQHDNIILGINLWEILLDHEITPHYKPLPCWYQWKFSPTNLSNLWFFSLFSWLNTVTSTNLFYNKTVFFRIFSLYSKSLPLDIACRVWDIFCRDGEEFLFRTALGKVQIQASAGHVITNNG